MNIIFLHGIKERLAEYLNTQEKKALTEVMQEVTQLKDKLTRRNMQIKDLKKYKTTAENLSILLGKLGYDLKGNKIY